METLKPTDDGFYGGIRQCVGDNDYIIDWKDKRAKKNETVRLDPIHETESIADPDRFHVCVDDLHVSIGLDSVS